MITAIILVIFLIYVFIGLSLTKALFAPEKYVEWSEDEGREVTFPSSHHTLQGRVFNEEGKKAKCHGNVPPKASHGVLFLIFS